MVGKLLELRPNKHLLDPNFSGYKLSLQPIEVNSRKLSQPVNVVLPNQDQFSFIHTKLFALQNHLINDPWDENFVYFIDKSWNVQRSSFCTDSEYANVYNPWQIPTSQASQSGNYNLSLMFASKDLAVASDGRGTLHLVQTQDRKLENRWAPLFLDTVLGPDKSFVIIDAKTEISSIRTVHCVLLSIEHNESSKCFDSVLNWVTLTEASNEPGTWGATALRTLRGKGEIFYCSLEKSCEAIYIASNASFEFTADSENKIITENEKKTETSPKLYLWQQSDDELTISLNIPETCQKNDLKIKSTTTTLEIKIADRIVLSGSLWHRIDSEITNWTMKDGKLSVSFFKEEVGLIWPQFLDGDDRGEYVRDPNLVEEVHRRLAHLCAENAVNAGDAAPTFNSQQLEECDITGETQVFERISALTHQVTDSFGLGGNQILFKVNLVPDEAPALAVRHDVDACLWQALPLDNDEQTWSVKHEGTLHAFGYVQASKQLKKFATCSPNLQYAVISESTRHIFLYRQSRNIIDGCELRNRGSGTRVNNVAEQQIITLPPNEEILGIHASKNVLFVLMSEEILFYQI